METDSASAPLWSLMFFIVADDKQSPKHSNPQKFLESKTKAEN
jgi:hypothetical protein